MDTVVNQTPLNTNELIAQGIGIFGGNLSSLTESTQNKVDEAKKRAEEMKDEAEKSLQTKKTD